MTSSKSKRAEPRGFGDALGFWNWLGSPEGAVFAFVGEGYRLDEGTGIFVREEDETLRRRFNRALRTILADGAYEEINARYFPFSIYQGLSGAVTPARRGGLGRPLASHEVVVNPVGAITRGGLAIRSELDQSQLSDRSAGGDE